MFAIYVFPGYHSRAEQHYENLDQNDEDWKHVETVSSLYEYNKYNRVMTNTSTVAHRCMYEMTNTVAHSCMYENNKYG